MKKKGKLIAIFLTFLLTAIAFATASYAWIIRSHNSGNIIFVTGEVKYELVGELKEEDLKIPKQELVKDQFKLTNNSTIETELRIEIKYQFSTDGKIDASKWILFDGDSVNETNNNTSLVIGVLSSDTDSDFVWNYNTVDTGENPNYYWYLSYKESETIPAETLEIPVMESLYINGNASGNENATKHLIVHITFQAKQQKYVEWDELGAITVVA